jgi:hypothetical protein
MGEAGHIRSANIEILRIFLFSALSLLAEYGLQDHKHCRSIREMKEKAKRGNLLRCALPIVTEIAYYFTNPKRKYVQ